jgi:Bacterial alpha-L-rhamnosidase concanavalin-like domain
MTISTSSYLFFILTFFLHIIHVYTNPIFSSGYPIWSNNSTSNFVLFRSPIFKLRNNNNPITAILYFAAEGSPRPPEGTTQAKLLGAAKIYVNGIFVSAGPGHNIPTLSQVVRAVDVRPFLRTNGADNVIGIASFFQWSYAGTTVPLVQALLSVTDSQGEYNITATDSTWYAWPADSFFNPTGNAGISWYPMPNEDLQLANRPLGWSEPGFTTQWPSAVEQNDWKVPVYFDNSPVPVSLARTVCNITFPQPNRQILDYGQEFMGGVNLTMVGVAGTKVSIILAEELMPGGTSVRSPLRTGNNWNSTWTLSGNVTLDSNIHHHEFVQFRYVQVDGAIAPLTFDTAKAWVVQHPAGGDGTNPFENACSTSTPATSLWGASPPPVKTPIATFQSSLPALDTVWKFCAYSIIATSLDVNVDGQTRERDVDVVDALNTALGQYYVFSPGDSSIQKRTMLEMATNDTGMCMLYLFYINFLIKIFLFYTILFIFLLFIYSSRESMVRFQSKFTYKEKSF